MRFATILFLMLSACATTYTNPNLKLAAESEYYSSLEEKTRKEKIYDGLYAKLEFTAVMLTTELSHLQVDQNARIYQWDLDRYSNEKSKVDSDLTKQTFVFLSFFTPERKNDDLHKPKTLWRVFLDANGKRYEGKVEKVKTLFAEVQTLYPAHNRWSTPYKITFPVPVSQIENSTSNKLTLTGPVTSASILL